MSLKELTIQELEALPSNEPLWVLNNAMAVALKHAQKARPSDVLIDVRETKRGRLLPEDVSAIVLKVETAMAEAAPDDAPLNRPDFVTKGLEVLRDLLKGDLRLTGSSNTTIRVPHDWRGFPFSCTDLLPRAQLLQGPNFRAAIKDGLIIPITTADAEWLIGRIAELHGDAEEPDRHEAFAQLMYGSDEEKVVAHNITVNPMDRVRELFVERKAEADRIAALNARPWYVKLLARVRGVE
ncbi:hypothetical protein D3C87_1049890 [compost metagenome]